jgi:hypothetical protein
MKTMWEKMASGVRCYFPDLWTKFWHRALSHRAVAGLPWEAAVYFTDAYITSGAPTTFVRSGRFPYTTAGALPVINVYTVSIAELANILEGTSAPVVPLSQCTLIPINKALMDLLGTSQARMLYLSLFLEHPWRFTNYVMVARGTGFVENWPASSQPTMNYIPGAKGDLVLVVTDDFREGLGAVYDIGWTVSAPTVAGVNLNGNLVGGVGVNIAAMETIVYPDNPMTDDFDRVAQALTKFNGDVNDYASGYINTINSCFITPQSFCRQFGANPVNEGVNPLNATDTITGGLVNIVERPGGNTTQLPAATFMANWLQQCPASTTLLGAVDNRARALANPHFVSYTNTGTLEHVAYFLRMSRAISGSFISSPPNIPSKIYDMYV